MIYYIMLTDGKERKILSQHEDKAEALEAGKKAWEKAPKGTTICCINGTLDENRNIKGNTGYMKSGRDGVSN